MKEVLKLDYTVEREIFGNRQNTFPLSQEARELAFTENCPYCGQSLDNLLDEVRPFLYEEVKVLFARRPGCSWWRKRWYPNNYSIGETFLGSLHAPGGAVATAVSDALAELHDDPHLPGLRTHQVEKWVGDLLAAAYGCEAVHVGRAGDGGVDILLFDSQDGPIAVQVKHRRSDGRAEGVAVVRELRGAMVLKGLERGIVVTTADRFSTAAKEAASSSPSHSTPQAIDLINARQLLDILRVVAVEAQEGPAKPSPVDDPYWPSSGPPSESTDLADASHVARGIREMEEALRSRYRSNEQRDD